MSARTELLGTLTSALEPKTYTVSLDAPSPTVRLLKGQGWVTVRRAGLAPNPGDATWAQALSVYLVVGLEDYAAAEDLLDELLPLLVAAIEAASHQVVTIDRDVFFAQGDADGRHGYRITTTTRTTTP